MRHTDTGSKNADLIGDRSGFAMAELRTALATGFYFEGLFYGDATAGLVG